MQTLSYIFLMLVGSALATLFFKIFWLVSYANWPSVPLGYAFELMFGTGITGAPVIGPLVVVLYRVQVEWLLLALAGVAFASWCVCAWRSGRDRRLQRLDGIDLAYLRGEHAR